jgi:predicted ATPase
LLAAPKRVLLRRLAVFVGGFTLDPAETVCAGDPIRKGDVLDLLCGLVDQSLVDAEARGPAPRFRLQETLRQYAAERLREAGEEAALRADADPADVIRVVSGIWYLPAGPQWRDHVGRMLDLVVIDGLRYRAPAAVAPSAGPPPRPAASAAAARAEP